MRVMGYSVSFRKDGYFYLRVSGLGIYIRNKSKGGVFGVRGLEARFRNRP